MATRSTIAVELPSGNVAQIYCHWDGYLEGVGKTLLTHYNDMLKAIELITLGDISSLGTVIGEKHPFSFSDAGIGCNEYKDKYGHMTTFYGRDRGEENVGFKPFSSFDDYVKNHQYEEYEYILRNDGQWYFCITDDCAGYEPLTAKIFDKQAA